MPPQPPRGGPRQRILPTPRGVNMIVWSLDNRFVLAAIMDCRICVWNAADGSIVHSLTGHTNSTYVLDVHPFNPRIAMSAGYDGRTIVWDIWEGTPIRIYEISRFKLVDGKFSPDGTSIILSDDVGQLYILNTGQGESQQDAKYDQFFLGDYRPLMQDTYGNIIDQETQLVPYRRNMQDLLCDSGMNPYPEPYQSMYQKRRLGALNMEWKPPSIKLTVVPDFSLDPDFQMLPLADLDVLVEPLPEFVDAMDWEPENEVQSEDSDSEYNVPEEYSTGGEQGSLNSSSSVDRECSAEDSEVEGRNGFHRSKRKKSKAEIEIMTSSGRRVKRRNLDECDGNTLRTNRTRKSRIGCKASKRKSSTSKGFRPQRAAARNALTLFSKITGAATDGEDEDSSEADSSESESSLQNSDIQSDESEKSLQNERNKHLKGKEVPLEDNEDFVKSHEQSHLNAGNRGKLVLKLPVRNSNKFVVSETKTTNHQIDVGPSSCKAPTEASNVNRVHIRSVDLERSSSYTNGTAVKAKERGQTDSYMSEGYRNEDIKWGGVKARTSKRQRFGEAMSSAAYARFGLCFSDRRERESNLNGHVKSQNTCGTSSSAEVQDYAADNTNEVGATGREDTAADTSDVVNTMTNGKEHLNFNECMDSDELPMVGHTANGNDSSLEFKESNIPISTKLRIKSRMISRESSENQGNEGSCILPASLAENTDTPVLEVPKNERTNRTTPVNEGDEFQEPNAQVDKISMPLLNDTIGSNTHPKKMFNVVYRRSKLSKDRANSEGDSGTREGVSHASADEQYTGCILHEDITDGPHRTDITGSKATTDDLMNCNIKLGQEHDSDDVCRNADNGSISSRCQLPSEEWGSSSRMTVGLRSSRNRRTSYHFRDASPVDRRKANQSGKKVSWLMLSKHEEGSRYIPQQGDEVVYFRQGHQEYIDYIGSRETGPWKSVKGHIRAVEFCKLEALEYSTLPGSGDSCCKMTLKFVDSTSDVCQKSFKLTLPEVTGFPDFLVERTRFDAAMRRNWTCRDKCRVYWKNDGEGDGSWWEGRILSVKAKTSEFPDSPWERYTIQYRSDPRETHQHSPWELFDFDSQWEQPHIDDEIRNKLISAFAKLEQSGNTEQDRYGIQKLRQVSQKTNFTNRYPVPLSLEVIQSRLENYYYRTLEAVKHDIEVMLTNSESYFIKNLELSGKMKRLSGWFKKTLSSL
ncbi:hypothetical protein JCGZ_18979 [Jatropha curcas]|uniref:Uncharacterized protein n=2 Tax=Jatropha curcas TaxID=180498 RepID=A0A067K7V5_JATCU|nr:hypothetical protein JCGZ_18979 [Jatropha curcas]